MATTKEEEFKKKFLDGNRIDDDLVLTEEIIGKLGIGPRSIKNVFENLVKNKVETWGNLRAVGSESENKKAIEAVGGKENEVAGTTLWNAIQDYNKRREERAESLKRPATTEEPKFAETFFSEPGTYFDFVPPSEFDETLRLVKASMQAPAVRNMTFVVCTGPMGVGKTRMGLELVKAAQNAIPGWKCGYVSSASALPRFETEDALEDLWSCFQVLSSALTIAFLGTSALGMVNITRQSVIAKVKRDLATDCVLLHIDEFSQNPLAVKMLMRGCAHQSLETSPELKLKVVPVTTGVQSVLDMDALPRGTRYGVKYVYLAPLAEEDSLERLKLALLRRIGVRDDQLRKVIDTCHRLTNLIVDCGGFPASLQELANSILNLREDHLADLRNNGHLDVAQAKDLYARLLENMQSRYSEASWANIFLRPNEEKRIRISTRTKAVLCRILLDALTGFTVEPHQLVSESHDPKITYKQVDTGGLIALKENPNEKGTYRVVLPLLAVSSMNGFLQVIEGDVLQNPFDYGFEIHEELALMSLRARLLHYREMGIKTCRLTDLRPGGLFAGQYQDLIIDVPDACMLHRVGSLFEGSMDLLTGLENKGSPLSREPGSMLMAAVGQKAVDAAVLLTGQFNKRKCIILFLSQSKWSQVFYPGSDADSTSKIQTKPANDIVEKLAAMKDKVVDKWIGERNEEIFVVYDVFSDRPKGGQMTEADIRVPHSDSAVVVVTRDSIERAVGPILGIRARLARVCDDEREDKKKINSGPDVYSRWHVEQITPI